MLNLLVALDVVAAVVDWMTEVAFAWCVMEGFSGMSVVELDVKVLVFVNGFEDDIFCVVIGVAEFISFTVVDAAVVVLFVVVMPVISSIVVVGAVVAVAFLVVAVVVDSFPDGKSFGHIFCIISVTASFISFPSRLNFPVTSLTNPTLNNCCENFVEFKKTTR